MPDPFSITSMFADVFRGAPEDVYLNMWYDDISFLESAENYAEAQDLLFFESTEGYDQAESLLMTPQEAAEFDLEVIEEVEPDALEKAVYQSTINDQQIMGLVQQGFGLEEAAGMIPGTAGIMTPYGEGLDNEAVGIVMDAYPGAKAYTGMDINDWEDIDFFGSMIEEAAGDKIETAMDNVEKVATSGGELNQLMDFFGDTGKAMGQAITQGYGFLDELTQALVGEELPPLIGPSPIAGPLKAMFKAIGEGEAQEGQTQLEVAEAMKDGITMGVDAVVGATEDAWNLQTEGTQTQASIYDAFGTAGVEALESIVSEVSVPGVTTKTTDPGGLLGGLHKGPFGWYPGIAAPQADWDFSKTTEKQQLLGLELQYKVFMDGLDELGVKGMATYLADPNNYDPDFPELDAEEVEEWLNSLSMMGEDQETIELLREGFSSRTADQKQVQEMKDADTGAGTIKAFDNVAQLEIQRLEMEQVKKDQEAAAQVDLSSGVGDPTGAGDITATDGIPSTEEVAGIDYTTFPIFTKGGPDLPSGLPSGLPSDPPSGLPDDLPYAGEVVGASFGDQFWSIFNQLPDSGSSEAQEFIGPRLENEAELIWHLMTDYPDINVNEALLQFEIDNTGVGEVDEKGVPIAITYTAWLNPKDESLWGSSTKPEGSDAVPTYGQHVLDFFLDPDEQRYGKAFYDNVEDLRNRMIKYDGKTQKQMVDIWTAWRTEGNEDSAAKDVNQRGLFMEGTQAGHRLSNLVAMYNTPKGSDPWLRQEVQESYKNLYDSWLRTNKSPESFLNTFVEGNRVAGGM